jgi:hypothetical protein
VSAVSVAGRTVGWLQGGARAQKVLPSETNLHLSAEAVALGGFPAAASLHEDNEFLDEISGFRGEIGDVLVFSRALDSTELNAVVHNLE